MKMIVTNLRIEENNWIQVKTIAVELGMSVNEYVNHLLQNTVSKAQFGYPKKTKTKNRKSFYDLLSSMGKVSSKDYKTGGHELSNDDKIIYGV